MSVGSPHDQRRSLSVGAQALHALTNATSVVVVGASADPSKLAGRTIPNLLHYGYSGRIVAVNPGRSSVNGQPCFPTVADLPEVPETAFIVSPAASVMDALRALEERGVATATVVASGFGDDGTNAGASRAAELSEFLRTARIRVLGPNSIGTLEVGHGAVFRATSNLPPAFHRGPVSVATQSGAISLILLHLLQVEGIGVNSVLPLGNAIDLGLADAVTYFARDGYTRCAVLFIESISDPDAFAEAVAEARAVGLRLVAICSGSSTTGSAIASGHTGALASDHRLVRAFLRDLGVIVADHPRQALDVARIVLADDRTDDRPESTGGALSLVSLSGGESALLADLAEGFGIDLPQPEGEHLDQLAASFRFTTPRNPLDVTADALTHPELFADAYRILATDPRIGRIAFVLPPLASFDHDRIDAVLKALPHDGPSVSVVDWPVAGEPVPPGIGFSDSAAFLAAFAAAQRGETFARPHDLVGQSRRGTPAGTPRWLPDDEVRERSRAAGLHLVDEYFVAGDGPDAVLDALPDVYPNTHTWVLKASVTDVAHKSDWGGVAVGLTGAQEIRAAWTQIRGRAEAAFPGRFRGAWLQQQVSGIEVYVGGIRHPDLGPFLVVGRGGVGVERGEVSFAALPAGEESLDHALRNLGSYDAVLTERGRESVEPAVLLAACHAIARLLDDPSVVSVDANPLFLPGGSAPAIAVDLRIGATSSLDPSETSGPSGPETAR